MPRDGTLAAVDAAILAGGLGTRLRSVVVDQPKVLASVAGRPFLSRLLDQLCDAHVRSIVLCTGYLGEQVEAAFGSAYRGVPVMYSREREPLGTGGALRHALSATTSDPVLVLNGDSYCHADLQGLASAHAASDAAASLVVTQVPDATRFGSVDVAADSRICGFVEKTAAHGDGWINAGIYLVARRLIAAIPSGVAVSLEREVFPRWLDDRFFAYRSPGPFLDIGTPASYAAAEHFFA